MDLEVFEREAALEVFEDLTEKQRQTMELLSEGRTSKEIARQLGISVSAVVQRVESLRAKAGGAMRKDLVRNYRLYQERSLVTCNQITGNSVHLAPHDELPDAPLWNFSGSDLELADAMTFERSGLWASQSEPRVVPEVLDGKDASLKRILVAILAALAMGGLMLVLITVAAEVSDLF